MSIPKNKNDDLLDELHNINQDIKVTMNQLSMAEKNLNAFGTGKCQVSNKKLSAEVKKLGIDMMELANKINDFNEKWDFDNKLETYGDETTSLVKEFKSLAINVLNKNEEIAKTARRIVS